MTAKMTSSLLLLMTMISISLAPPVQNNTSSAIFTDLEMANPCGAGTLVQPSPQSPWQYPTCVCMKPYISLNDEKCAYKAKSKLGAFLLSFLLGNLGVDWFYLSGGDAGYIIAGIFKIITLGGFGIWWLVDWIRVLTDSFPDGMGMYLFNDL